MMADELFKNAEAILRLIPAHVYWLDRNNVYRGCNDMQAKSFGLNHREEIVGKDNKSLPRYKNYQEHADRLDEINLKVMGEDKAMTLEEPKLLKDGTELVFISCKMPLHDERGHVIGLLGVSFNINEIAKNRKQLVAEKAQIETTLGQIIAHLPGHVYWKDRGGVYLGCNDLQAINYGLNDSHEVIGKTDFDFFNQENAESVRENDRQVIETGEPITAEEPVKMNNKHVTMLSQKVPLKNILDEIIGILGISLDITELKDYQAKLKNEKNAKTKFLSMMAHEIITPISNVINCIDLYKNHADKEFLDTAKSEANSLIATLHDVIAYVGFDETKIAPEQSEANLLEIVTKVFEKQNKNKCDGVVLTIDEFGGTPEKVMINAEHLYIVLGTLISNAIKYTKQGEIKVRVKDIQEKDQSFFEITVSDTGRGIHQNELRSIIGNFDLSKEPDTYNEYCKPSVKIPYAYLLTKHALLGEFKIESTFGVGTVITLKIPYNKLESEAEGIAVQDKTHAHQILMIEDNKVSSGLQGKILADLNCQVDFAESAEEGLEKAKNQRYDFIFLDITLPGMSGLEAIPLFQETRCSSTPIVGLTSHISEADIETFTNSGMVTVLKKPMGFEQVERFFRSYTRSLKADN